MTDPTNVNDPGTVDPADQAFGTGLPAQAPTNIQVPSSNSGPTQEVEGQAFGTGLPQNVTGNG
jgi:hypothetical protein